MLADLPDPAYKCKSAKGYAPRLGELVSAKIHLGCAIVVVPSIRSSPKPLANEPILIQPNDIIVLMPIGHLDQAMSSPCCKSFVVHITTDLLPMLAGPPSNEHRKLWR